LARIFVRRGLKLNAYNAYQSIIRGGHILLTVRVRDEDVETHGDDLDLLVCLNQDTMTRHARHLTAGGHVIFNCPALILIGGSG
jgi:2-oxoglutarate ferredoxin oxidoreductase subunit alpha